MLCTPTYLNLVHAQARIVVTVHELKYQMQTLVAALAHVTLQQLREKS